MSTKDGGLRLRCRVSREPRPLPGAPQGLRLSGDLESKNTGRSASYGNRLVSCSLTQFLAHIPSLLPVVGKSTIFWRLQIADLDDEVLGRWGGGGGHSA